VARPAGAENEGAAAGVETVMQTWEAITSRRNVRSFDGRPIPAVDLDQILEAGRRSPSSQNWQPWDFVVVTDRRGRAPRPLVSPATRQLLPGLLSSGGASVGVSEIG
jgi:nitroreductase